MHPKGYGTTVENQSTLYFSKNMSHLQIRPYTPADKPQLLALLRENTPMYFAPAEEPDFVHYLAHEIEQYFVVEKAGQIVGCGGINFEADKTLAKISWDIIAPHQQGKGIGSLLLQHRLQVIRQYATVQKIMVRTSQVAYLFYEKNGFSLVKIAKDYWAKGFDLYQMEYVG